MAENHCYRDSRIAWVVILDRAREQGDREREREARRELRRLGMIVRYVKAAGGAA